MANRLVRAPLNSVQNPIEIGSVPNTKGEPTWTPKPDQLPLAYDQNTNLLYVYNGEWKAHGFSSLPELDLSNIKNLEDTVKIPIFYEVAGQKIEGYLTLKEFKNLFTNNGEL